MRPLMYGQLGRLVHHSWRLLSRQRVHRSIYALTQATLVPTVANVLGDVLVHSGAMYWCCVLVQCTTSSFYRSIQASSSDAPWWSLSFAINLLCYAANQWLQGQGYFYACILDYLVLCASSVASIQQYVHGCTSIVTIYDVSSVVIWENLAKVNDWIWPWLPWHWWDAYKGNLWYCELWSYHEIDFNMKWL